MIKPMTGHTDIYRVDTPLGYGRRRTFPTEAVLRRRATRWCVQTKWRIIALNYPGVLRLFRDQQRMRYRERWTAHL